MKPLNHVRHMIIGLIFAVVFVLLMNPKQEWSLLIVVAFIGSLVPDMDFGFNLRLKKSTWNFIANAFFIPFLLSLALPGNIYRTAFFIGYTSHLIADMNRRNHWVFIRERTLVAVLWLISLLILTVFLNVDFNTVIKFVTGGA